MSLSLLRLQSLGPKELLEDFDVLSKWIDCASWYSPPVNWLPLTDSVTCDKHHACSVVPNSGPHAQKSHDFPFTFVIDWKIKKDCCFPPRPIWAEGLWCVRLYVSKQCWAGFSYLTALQHPVLYVGCPFRAWCLLEPGQRQQPPTHFYRCIFFFLKIRARKLCIQVCNFTDMIQTRSKAYWGALVHS